MQKVNWLTLAALSGLLMLMLMGCSDGDDGDEFTHGQSGSEQHIEVSGSESNELFDVNTVNIAPIERADFDGAAYYDEHQEEMMKSIDVLNEIIMQGGELQFGDNMIFAAARAKSGDESVVALALSEDGGFSEMFETYLSGSRGMFMSGRGEEGMKIIKDSFVTLEEREAFDQTVIQVIKDAEESGPGNIYRLLDQVLEIDEPNTFVIFTAGILAGYLSAPDFAHEIKIDQVRDHLKTLSSP
ncbi:MAG: hypothetical protein FWE48_03875 [Coriobacteriia bacterium]|nr:hypothetical protein [Coriobacteriia bacterium]